MSCDNIITVYACGVIDAHYYMAMEILSRKTRRTQTVRMPVYCAFHAETRRIANLADHER